MRLSPTPDRPVRALIAAILALGLLLAACGDDDADTATADTSANTSPDDADAPGADDDAEDVDDVDDADGAAGAEDEPDDAAGAADDGVVRGTDGCDSDAVDPANWSALSAGAEEGESGAAGAAAGFQNLEGAAQTGVAEISLISRGRSEVLLRMPVEVLAQGGTFDLSEPLPDVSDNALLLAEYGAPVEGTVVVCVADNGAVNGTFEVTATSVADGEVLFMQGEFNGIKVA